MLNSHLIQYTQAGSGFTRVEQLGVCRVKLTNILCRLGCDTAHTLEDIQRETLATQQRRIRCLHLEDHITLLYCVTILEVGRKDDVLLETLIDHTHNIQTRDYALLLGSHGGNGIHRCGDNRFGCNITCVDILLNTQIEEFGD